MSIIATLKEYSILCFEGKCEHEKCTCTHCSVYHKKLKHACIKTHKENYPCTCKEFTIRKESK